MSLIIGSHVSFNKEKQLLGCVEKTINYGANAFMFYTGAPQNTNRFVIDDNLTKQALNLMQENNIDFNYAFVHAPYIINLANDKNKDFAISFLKQEIKRCEQLGINKIILHPGNHVGLGLETGINNIIKALNEIINSEQKVIIYLETMSGKGTECGSRFEELKQIIDGVIYKDKIMICFDTCHLHDAGYNLKEFSLLLEEFDQIIGLNKLGCIHLNDSKNLRSAKKDRHQNIGLGYIGFQTLLAITYHDKLINIPKILETPYITTDNKESYPPYKFEIKMLKEKKINDTLINDIKEFYKKTN
jgi:deoxyribonuclease-4